MSLPAPIAPRGSTRVVQRQGQVGANSDLPRTPGHQLDTASDTLGKLNVSCRRHARIAKHAPYTVRVIEVRGETARFVSPPTLPQEGTGAATVEIEMDDDEMDEEAAVQAVLGELSLLKGNYSERPSPAPSTAGSTQGDTMEHASTDSTTWPCSLFQDGDDDKTAAVEKWLQGHSVFKLEHQASQARTQCSPHVDRPRLGEIWHAPFGLQAHYPEDRFMMEASGLGFSTTWIPSLSELEFAVRDQLALRKRARLVSQSPNGKRSVLGEWDDGNVGEWLVNDSNPEGATRRVLKPVNEGKAQWEMGARKRAKASGDGQRHGAGVYFEEHFTVVQGNLYLTADHTVHGGPTPGVSTPTTADCLPHPEPDSMDVDSQENVCMADKDYTNASTLSSAPARYYLLIKKHLEHDRKLLASTHIHGPLPQGYLGAQLL